MELKDEDNLKNNGAKPGILIKYKRGTTPPQRIEPAQLSQGHAQLAQEHRQDLRDQVGINTETLAVENDQSSGRAIAQRIRQGMTQVQGLFDNYARTKRNFGRFMVAIMPKVFDVPKLKRVLGEKFLQDNFSVPVMAPVTDPATGQPAVDPKTGQPVMAPQLKYDEKLADQTIGQVLQDVQIGVYDIAIGEIVAASTAMYGQFQEALELRNSGLPIPPDVLLDTSSLSESNKKKTMAALAAAAQQPPAKPQKAA